MLDGAVRSRQLHRVALKCRGAYRRRDRLSGSTSAAASQSPASLLTRVTYQHIAVGRNSQRERKRMLERPR
jgi:hypothetical protein